MPSSQDLSFYLTIPLATWDTLEQLFQQMAHQLGAEAVVLTETTFSLVSLPLNRFTLLLSQRFSALLMGEKDSLSSVKINLTFEPEAIALFINQLSALLPKDAPNQPILAHYCQVIQPNDSQLQSQFTLLLLSTLMPQATASPEYPAISVCQPVENALQEQIAYERLLNHVTTQIRQSLELPVILATAVNQVRELLQLDRLVIYQFAKINSKKSESFSFSPSTYCQLWQEPSGCIIYESRAHEAISSVLNYQEKNCLLPNNQCWEKYRQGFVLAVDNVETTYGWQECLLDFLKTSQVKAKLVAPIVVQEELWGLLIANQCTLPRHWQDNEKNLLQQIAEQLAIAIYQAELMVALQHEKQTLEQRVIERTQALHDALLAAQAASRTKSEFLATMNHELRSPLTSVIGLSSTLLNWSMGELSQRQRHYLQIINNSGKQLLALINDILELSQLEAGKAVLNKSEFSLTKLAEASLRSFADKAQSQGIQLKSELKLETSSLRVTADCQRIQRIIWNILSNAIKFTPNGGQVILRAWLENNWAVLQVEDTGIGIAEQDLPLLFEKFQQIEGPYCRCYEGTGLGLALTKHLVELHQGRIEVESHLGVGSIFTVWLPCS